MSGKRGRNKAGRGLLAAGAVMLAAAAGLAFWVWSSGRAASVCNPAGEGRPAEEVPAADDGFSIDWDWWRQVNPDVCGWVRVDGTDISLPVVQAHEDRPTWYLSHDVYGNWNIHGAAYLDAACAEGGLLGSLNATVMAHHMDDGTMFSEISGCSEPGWADEHPYVDLYAPDGQGGTLHEKRAVLGCEEVDGDADAKRASPAGPEAMRQWLAGRLGLDASSLASVSKCVTLATCGTWALGGSDVREVVHAAI